MTTTPEAPRRILWVDDEIDFLRAHILFLRHQGWVVEVCTNGHDAVDRVREEEFDVVLLDEQMAGSGGLTTLSRIKERQPSPFVVMVTKSEEENVMEQAVGRDIDGYLTKPVNPAQIVGICRSLFQSRALRSHRLTSRYVRQYAENKARLTGPRLPADFEAVALRLARWDLHLDAAGQEGLQETHAGQRHETDQLFQRFVEDHWFSWMGRGRYRPRILPEILPREIAPALQGQGNLVLVVLRGLRLDQWISMQALLEGFFEPDLEVAWSLLPGIPAVTLPALLGGALPVTLGRERESWRWPDPEHLRDPLFLRALLERGLANCDVSPSLHLEVVETLDDGRRLAQRTADLAQRNGLVAILWNALPQIQMLRDAEDAPQTRTAATSRAFRHHSRRFLALSGLYLLLRRLAQAEREVMLVSDAGSTLAREAVEVFGEGLESEGLRVRFGSEISCDERHALFLEHPPSAGLDPLRGAAALVRGHRFFAQPNKFQYHGISHRGSLLQGGFSMDEMLVPLCRLRPR